MTATYTGFVDVGFLRAEGARAIREHRNNLRPDAAAIVAWFRSIAGQMPGQGFLRAYWYDSAFDPNHPHYSGQRSFFDAIGLTPGIQLRLGHIAERPSRLEQPIRRALENTAQGLGIAPEKLMAEFDRNWKFRLEREQKGVDTLIALDMVRLAGRSIFSTAVLVAGDRDLADAIRAVQDFGCRVLVATPYRPSVAREVAQLADDMIDLRESDIRQMLTPRPPSTHLTRGPSEEME